MYGERSPTMKKFFLIFIFMIPIFTAFCTAEPGQNNWKWSANDKTLTITFDLPHGYYAYAGNTRPVLMPAVNPINAPKAIVKKDPVMGENQDIYPGGKKYHWSFDLKTLKYPLSLSVEWQLCREPGDGKEAICLLPGEAGIAVFESAADLYKKQHTPIKEVADNDSTDEQLVFLQKFKVLRRVSGYQSPKELRAFLRGDDASNHFSFEDKGVLMSLLFALFGGLLLNLTPCVLPLIPVNLAVIGAGANSQNPKKERILRGCLYGAGIALTYGILGVVAVLTGTTFGQLDSSWIFNGIAAVIFLILGLAMFGVFNFDLSAISGKFRMPSAAGRSGVFLMGAFTAILAGACVAPVIAAALVQAAKLSAHGNYAGLCLPFLVGLGMALPWPFAAAGIAFFPKPGGWMNYVKMILGILILCLAAYYAWITYTLLNTSASSASWQEKNVSYQEINHALTRSAAVNKPVLLDFGASWCKACTLMEKNSFPDPAVQKELENVILLKVPAEKPSDPPTAELLKTFEVKGLPELILIQPESMIKKHR